MKSIDKFKLTIIALSLILYIIACCYPAIYLHFPYAPVDTTEKYRIVLGIDTLLNGWVSCITFFMIPGRGQFAWVTNVFFVFAILAFWRHRTHWKLPAWVWALLAVIAGSTFISCHEIAMSESGSLWRISHKGIGFYLWLISLASLFFGILIYNLSTWLFPKLKGKHGIESPS